MASGDQITRNNLPTPQYNSGSWDSKGSWDRPQQYWWVSGPVIYVSIETVGVFLRNPEMWITISRWDGTGSTFTQVASGYIASSGAETKTWRWGHNCSGTLNASDNGNTHLYKLDVTWDGAGASTMTLYVNVGSVKSTFNNNPNTYAQGTLIRACKPEIWNKGATYNSDEEFISNENPMARRGTPINWTVNANFCYGEY